MCICRHTQAPAFKTALQKAPVVGGTLSVEQLLWNKLGAYCMNQNPQHAPSFESVLVVCFNQQGAPKPRHQHNFVGVPTRNGNKADIVRSVDYISFTMLQVT